MAEGQRGVCCKWKRMEVQQWENAGIIGRGLGTHQGYAGMDNRCLQIRNIEYTGSSESGGSLRLCS